MQKYSRKCSNNEIWKTLSTLVALVAIFTFDHIYKEIVALEKGYLLAWTRILVPSKIKMNYPLNDKDIWYI